MQTSAGGMMVDTQTLSELQKILLHLSTDLKWMVTRRLFPLQGCEHDCTLRTSAAH
jgi:hypothetical protein